MTNIVDHLRACAYNLSLDLGAGNCEGVGWRETMNTFADAADEIERLRQQLSECERERNDALRASMNDMEQLATVTKERYELLSIAQEARRWLNPIYNNQKELWTRINAIEAKLGADKTGEALCS